jgi:hypothetical protein
VVLDPAASPEAYRTAMSAFMMRSTIKITGVNRHPHVDALLLENVDLDDAVIADVGASDGTTSVELIARLPQFGAFVIADLFMDVTAVATGARVLFRDHDENPILVVGPRLLAWPAASPLVRLLYWSVERSARRTVAAGVGWRTVPLLNPEARELLRRDPRVTCRQHDVFQPWTGPTPDVIKVANLLRRLYFSDQDIDRALRALLATLPEGGHLLIADNARAKVPARGGLYRRERGHFVGVAVTDPPPEIDQLVRAAWIAEPTPTSLPPGSSI